MATLKSHLLFSWKTSAIGLISAVYAIAQPFMHKDTTFIGLIHDQGFIMALVVAAVGFFSKDADAHGTPSAPITPQEALQVAAVASTVPLPLPKIVVGAPINGSPVLFSVGEGDTVEIGKSVIDPNGTGTFIKSSSTVYVKTA